MSFQEIKEIARKTDNAKGTEREKLVKELIECLEGYDLIGDVGWERIKNAREAAKILGVSR